MLTGVAFEDALLIGNRVALALASLYIDNTKPICYNIAKKNSWSYVKI